MADKRLVLYIKEQLKRGYDLYTIRNHLINYGYSSAAVDESIDGIYKPTIRHEIHLSKSTIIALSSIFVALILIVTAFFMFEKEPKQLLDLKIDVIKDVKAGEELEFSLELSSLGAAKRYDVLLKYDVVKDKKIITSKEETIALETRTSAKSRIKILNDAEQGNYLLKATAKYNGRIATASDSFRVYKEIEEFEEEVIEEPQEEEEEIIEEEKEDIEEAKPVEEDELAGLNTWEKLEKIKEISISDPEKAGNYCSNIEEPYKDRCFLNIAETTKLEVGCGFIKDKRLKDDCYSKVAKLTDNYELCEKISTERTTDTKDSCYMNFVIDGNYEVCDRLVNEYLKQSCEALKSIESEAE